MKSLYNFIQEAQADTKNPEAGAETTTVDASKTFTFSFSELEKADETIESLKNLGEESGIDVTVEKENVTIVLKKEQADKMDSILDVLNQYIEVCNKSGHRHSSEGYAQRLKSIETSVNAINDYIESIGAAEEAKKDNDDTKEKNNKDNDEE